MTPDHSQILLRELGEFSLHQWLSSALPCHPLDRGGIGDDCAILEITPEQYLLLTTDRVPLSAYKRSYSYLGKLCVTHNFSDIICKGGQPIGLLLGTYVPRDTRLEDWKAITLAAQEWAGKFGGCILGGDTKEATNVTVVGCAIGMVEKNSLMRRDTAKAGDIVAVSLTSAQRIGLPWAYILATSLKWDLSKQEYEFLEERFTEQNLSLPYKETLAANQAPGITASVDSSDGFGGALHLLSKSNKVGIDLYRDELVSCLDDRVPAYAERLGLDLLNFAFTPGYVWENVFAIRSESFDDVRTRVRAVGGELVKIGIMTDEYPKIRLMQDNGSVRNITLFFNEGFRSDREISNSTEAWLNHRLFKI